MLSPGQLLVNAIDLAPGIDNEYGIDTTVSIVSIVSFPVSKRACYRVHSGKVVSRYSGTENSIDRYA